MSQSVCRDPVNALLLWHVSGSLGSTEDTSVREHLTSCGVCAREVETLRRLTAAMIEHPEVLEPVVVPGSTTVRWAWGLAAALAVPALLGLYWIYLGFPMAGRVEVAETVPPPHDPAVAPPPIQSRELLHSAVQLDLGGGPRRDAASTPTLFLTPEAESIVMAFRIPPRDDGRFSVTIERRDGRPVTAPADLSAPDSVGRHAYTFSADLLRSGGEFDLVLRLRQEMGDGTVYRYPFRVETRTPAAGPPG